jgi:hypothetical protein
MDLLNREWLIRQFQPRYQDETAVGIVDNELTFDLETARLRNVRRFRYGGRRRSLTIEFRVYTLAEMVRLLGEAGLRYQRAYGNFEGAAYGMDSFRMILVAGKPASPATKSVRSFGSSMVHWRNEGLAGGPVRREATVGANSVALCTGTWGSSGSWHFQPNNRTTERPDHRTESNRCTR